MHEMVLRDTLYIKHDDYLNGPVVHEALDDTIMRFHDHRHPHSEWYCGWTWLRYEWSLQGNPLSFIFVLN